MTNPLDEIGKYGPILNFIITGATIASKKKYFIAFIISSIINHYSNSIFKILFKEPRPGIRIDGSDLETRIKEFGDDKYGMPSYHAQTTFFSITYLYLVSNQPFILVLELTIWLLTLVQRWTYKRHDVKQLIAGSIIGGIMAYLSYYMTNYYLTTQ